MEMLFLCLLFYNFYWCKIPTFLQFVSPHVSTANRVSQRVYVDKFAVILQRCNTAFILTALTFYANLTKSFKLLIKSAVMEHIH